MDYWRKPGQRAAITTNCFDFNVQEANINLFFLEAFVAFQPMEPSGLRMKGTTVFSIQHHRLDAYLYRADFLYGRILSLDR